ncbi:MAG: ADP-ribosylglycohydrolase family protein [Desulfobacter sp.]|nr:MAG: ADP-ribosylglycohydrolase family protein [Desulfobacter sp.]
MTDHAHDMVKASLAADSLALGVHWIYDTDQIKSGHGRVDRLLAPAPGSYHSTKTRGEFTHYGDQTLTLLESVARNGGFALDRFFSDWQVLFSDYTGYMDMATKGTLRNIARDKGPESCGSASNDIAGASRMAPIVLGHRGDAHALDKAVRDQTRMTHNDEATIDTAAFFARVCLAGLEGISPSETIRHLAENDFSGSPAGMWAIQGLDAADKESIAAVAGFGQSCHTPEAFGGVVQIIARYERQPGEGIVQAVMAGGDNAARASLVGQVLAAYNGADDAVNNWFDGLVKKELVLELLNKIA